jgi:hypothetical protein
VEVVIAGGRVAGIEAYLRLPETHEISSEGT